jgi:hypothetical protein
MADLHPIITFQVNLFQAGLYSDMSTERHQTSQNLALSQINASADTRSIGIPGAGTFKHGEKFTVCGNDAIRIKNQFAQEGGILVVCELDEDVNCVEDIGEIPPEDVDVTATGSTIMLPVGSASVVNRGAGHHVSDTLTLVGGTFTDVAQLTVATVSTIAGQDETSFTGGELTGTFTGGSGYSVSDTINLTDGTVIVVDAVSVGAVTEFTISSASTSGNSQWATISQSFSSGEPAGTSFTLTLDTSNQGVFGTSYVETSEIIDGEYTVLPSDPVSTTSSNAGVTIDATFNIDWGVREVVVTDGGVGYDSAPAVSFSGGSGTTAVATLTDDAVTSVTVTASGSGYSEQATVTFDAP